MQERAYRISRAVAEPWANLLVFTAEVFLVREPTDPEVDAILRRFPELVRSGESTDLPDGLGRVFLNDTEPGALEIRDRGLGGDVPRTGIISGQVEADGIHRHVAVRVPFSDTRAKECLDAEASQLPKGEIGLVMAEIGDVASAFRIWPALIERRYTPRQHTRVSGTVLFRERARRDGGNAVDLQTKVVWNPHGRPVPEWLRDRIVGA